MVKRTCTERFAHFWTDERVKKVLSMEAKKKSAEVLVMQVGSVTNVELAREYNTNSKLTFTLPQLLLV